MVPTKYLKLGIIALIVLAIPLTLFALKQRLDDRQRASEADFKLLSTATAKVPPFHIVIGPGADPASKKVYVTYQLLEQPFDLVVLDPANNFHMTVFKSPVDTSYTGSTVTIGSDNNIYIGTKDDTGSHLLKFIPATEQFIDIGKIPNDPDTGVKQTYVWDATRSQKDNAIYGCTFPSANLFRYNPTDSSPQIVNLGSVDPGQTYAHWCVADPNPESPYIYVGTGSVKQKIIAYNIETKEKKELVTSDEATWGTVFLGTDNMAYGLVDEQYYRLQYDVATPISTKPTKKPTNIFDDLSRIVIDRFNSKIKIILGTATLQYDYPYPAQRQIIHRLGRGPDQAIYASTALPFNFFEISSHRRCTIHNNW